MSDPDPYCHGDYSYYANAARTGPSGGSSDTSAMFPPGWSTPGDEETATSTIRRNAVEGLWLPLYIPEGCDGHKGDTDVETGAVLPEVIYYAANHVASMFDQQFGPAHSSPEVDEERYVHACELALDAAKNTSGGGPNVREVG